jgi:hypothetical protein
MQSRQHFGSMQHYQTVFDILLYSKASARSHQLFIKLVSTRSHQCLYLLLASAHSHLL